MTENGPAKRAICQTTDRGEDSVGSACDTCAAPLAIPRDTHDPPPSRPSPQGALRVVDVKATLWHSGVSWCAAWTAGGMVERPSPPARGPAPAWPLAIATRWSAGGVSAG